MRPERKSADTGIESRSCSSQTVAKPRFEPKARRVERGHRTSTAINGRLLGHNYTAL